MDLRPFLEEDVGAGDVTTDAFVPDIRGRARITCEEDAVVAGLEEAAGIFALLGVSSSMLAADGDRVAAGAAVMALDGPLRGILTGERTALNFLMRMSGVATCTGRAVGLVRGADPPLMIAATRKTTPGFRFFEKKAVALGGGWPHRSGLHDMAMAKDNHILACGGLDAVLRRLPGVPGGVKVEVEVSSVEDGVRAA
ncbi:MAG: nicotinate-nucleotide diphosphorylase (carboxylating), partial [Methanomassiliicoccaceae archaeon]|nr:nicotinate-nucleotide diphosphorylase (carboxylating) [Methanomassiliicoccaceae archaeon]